MKPIRAIAGFLGFNLPGLVIGVCVGILITGLSVLLIGLAQPLMMLEWTSVFLAALFALFGVLEFTNYKARRVRVNQAHLD